MKLKSYIKKLLKSPLAPYLFLLFLTLALRMFQFSKTSIYVDEITWTVRGKEFIYALLHRNLDYFKIAWWTDTTQVEAIGLPLSFLSGLFHILLAGQSKFSLQLLPDLVAARIPITLLVSLTPLVIYRFVSLFFKKRAAFLAAFLYLINPVVIGLDRWLLHDSLLTLFSFLAITSFIIAIKNKRISFLPGIFLSLAFLTKPNGILPIITWGMILLINLKDGFTLRLFAGNILVSLTTILIIWPASWFNPLMAPVEYLLRQAKLVDTGMVTSYFFGKASTNPHWSYYLFQLVSRTPEVSLLGIILSVFLVRFKKVCTPFLLSVVAYWLISFIMVSASHQKLGIRYVLPLIPWLAILAGLGWDKLLSIVKKNFSILILVSILIASLIPLKYNPDYYLYYNLLVSGPQNAKKFDMVGLCYGSREALDYMHQNDLAGTVYIAGCQDVALYYTGLPLTKDITKADFVILESAFAQQFPSSPQTEFISSQTLIQTLNLKGIEISYLYRVKL